MTDPQKNDRPPWVNAGAGTLAGALVFGAIFGFLLQKGGVAKFDILIGVLLLEDFTVVKVMGSAIVVGMLGVLALRRAGLLELQIKETVLGSNIIGGLIFGVGFGLTAYCPGTMAAAAGQGNGDALPAMGGMLLGSYLFALTSGWTERTVGSWGKLGTKRLPDMVRAPGWAVTVGVALVLAVVLAALEGWGGGAEAPGLASP